MNGFLAALLVCLVSSSLFASKPEVKWETLCRNASESFKETTDFQRSFIPVLCEGADVPNGSVVFSAILLKSYLKLLKENYPKLADFDGDLNSALAHIYTVPNITLFPRSPVFVWWSYKILLNFFIRSKMYFPSTILPQVNEIILRLSKLLSVPFDLSLEQYDDAKKVTELIKPAFDLLSRNPFVAGQVQVLSPLLEFTRGRGESFAPPLFPERREAVVGISELRRRVRFSDNSDELANYDDIQKSLKEVSPFFFRPGRQFFERLSEISLPKDDADLVNVFLSSVYSSALNYYPFLPLIDFSGSSLTVVNAKKRIDILNAGLGIGGIHSFPRAPVFIRAALEILSTIETVVPYSTVGQKASILALARDLKVLSQQPDDFFSKPEWKLSLPEAKLREILKREHGNYWIRGIQPALTELLDFL